MKPSTAEPEVAGYISLSKLYFDWIKVSYKSKHDHIQLVLSPILTLSPSLSVERVGGERGGRGGVEREEGGGLERRGREGDWRGTLKGHQKGGLLLKLQSSRTKEKFKSHAQANICQEP